MDITSVLWCSQLLYLIIQQHFGTIVTFPAVTSKPEVMTSQPEFSTSPGADTTDIFWTGSVCETLNNAEISSRYPGIFHTVEELEAKASQFLAIRLEYLEQQGVTDIESLNTLGGDGDSCCETKIMMFANTTMVNLFGVTRYIVHMPTKYQYIPHGTCLSKGKCQGICVIEPITHTLLTYNISSGTLEFDQFIVPGYCSCKETYY